MVGGDVHRLLPIAFHRISDDPFDGVRHSRVAIAIIPVIGPQGVVGVVLKGTQQRQPNHLVNVGLRFGPVAVHRVRSVSANLPDVSRRGGHGLEQEEGVGERNLGENRISALAVAQRVRRRRYVVA